MLVDGSSLWRQRLQHIDITRLSYNAVRHHGTRLPRYKEGRLYNLLLLHPFPLLCGGWCFLWDASIELGLELPPLTILSPTSRSWCFQPPPICWWSSPSFPRHLYHHHSLAYVWILLLFSIHAHTTSTYFLGYFSHFCCPSNSFIPYSVQLGDSTHPSQHPNFHHIQLLLVVSSLRKSWHRTSLLVLQPSCIGDYFPLDPQTYYSTTQNIQYIPSLPVFSQSDCIVCTISASKSPFSVNVAPSYFNNNNNNTGCLLPAISPMST